MIFVFFHMDDVLVHDATETNYLEDWYIIYNF